MSSFRTSCGSVSDRYFLIHMIMSFAVNYIVQPLMALKIMEAYLLGRQLSIILITLLLAKIDPHLKELLEIFTMSINMYCLNL